MSDNVFNTLQSLIQDRQNARILRLHFPDDNAPASPLLVNKLDAVESLSHEFSFTLEILTDDANLELKQFMSKRMTVGLVQANGELRYFNGLCSNFRFLRSDAGYSFYQAQLTPWTHYLGLRKNNIIFHGKTLRQITEQIFAQYSTYPDWDFRVRDEGSIYTDLCQYDETDLNFLLRHWSSRGWHFFFQHTKKGHKLIISDDSTAAAAIGDDPQVRFQRHGGAIEEDGIAQWSPVRQVMPSSVALTGFNFKYPVPSSVSIPTLNKQGSVLSVEHYESTGAFGVKNSDDADRLARLKMEEFECAAKFIEAAGNNRRLLPGEWFRLINHFAYNAFGSRDDVAKSEFLIISVHHVATNNYLQQAGAPATYSNRMTCLRKAIPWRPGHNGTFHDTQILAPQTATVVGPKGQGSVHTDEYGRIRVQFHWDRIGQKNEQSSAWIRVSSSWAGGQLGAMAIPRVGAEVLVEFLNGDPSRPIVTGCLFNQRNMSPWALPSQQALTGFRSRELTPTGGNEAGGRSNHLILDDSNQRIQAQLKSDHQCSQLSLGYITRIENNSGRQDYRGDGWEIFTNSWGALRAGKGMLLTTEARNNAASHVTDMAEPVQRLTQARELHENLAEAAQQSGAQENQGQQADIAQAIKKQNDAIKGSGTTADGSVAELTAPHLVIASPAGIETTTAQSTHISSDQHTAITTGKSLSIASGDSLFASIGNTFRLLVQRAGMKLIAAAGDIDLQALTNSINILAKLNITQTANRITITAKEEVVINGGGSYVKFNAAGIEHGTNGLYVAHAASHSMSGPRNMAIPAMPTVPIMPLTTGDHSVQFLMKSEKGKPLANYPYVMENKSGIRYEGITDAKGQTMRIFTPDKEKFTVKLNKNLADNDVDVPPASEKFE